MIRDKLTTEQRSRDLIHTIDPGFVNRRKIQTLLGEKGMEIIDQLTKQLPALAEWQREVRIDHIYTRIMLDFCKAIGIKEKDNTERTGRSIIYEEIWRNRRKSLALRKTTNMQFVMKLY